MSVTTQQSLTLDELLGLAFPEVGPTEMIRFEAQSRRDFGNLSTFFSHRGGRWHWPPDASPVTADTPTLCVQRNQDTEVTWSPLIYVGSPMPGAPARLPVAFCVLPVKVVASPRLPGYGSPDPESEREALARFAAISSSFALHEGRRLVLFWRLKEALPAPAEPIVENRNGRWPCALNEQVRAQVLLWHLAQKLNGSRDALDPRRETFAIPGVPMAGIFPRREVSVILGNDVERRFSVDEL